MRARQGVEEEAVSLASLGAEVEELVGSEEDGELAGLVEKSLTHIETSGGGILSHQRDQHCTFLSCFSVIIVYQCGLQLLPVHFCVDPQLSGPRYLQSAGEVSPV